MSFPGLGGPTPDLELDLKMPFKKTDPTVEALADVERHDAQIVKLAARRSDLSLRLDEVRAARRAALISGELDDAAQATVDKAHADAAETLGFVDEEIASITGKRDAAQRHLDGLRDAVRRAEIVADCELRASAIDDAAEKLARAAQGLGRACDDMIQAIADHGARVDDVLSTSGSTSAVLLGRSIIRAALHMAAPSLHSTGDGLGVPFDADPVMVARRGQSGRLLDHRDAVRENRVAAVDMPRIGSTVSIAPALSSRGSVSLVHAGLALSEPTARTVFAVPVMFTGVGGLSMTQAEPGDTEAPARVVRKAEDLELAFPPDSAEGRAIVARLKASGGTFRARPRTYIDTSNDAEAVPAAPARTVTTTWPDERGVQA